MTLPPGDSGQLPAYPERQPPTPGPSDVPPYQQAAPYGQYPPAARYAGPQPPAAPARYGRVGVVPWTFAQTLIGTAITLVPWVLLIVVAQVLAPPSATPVQPLPRTVDAATAVVTFIFTAVVEAAFLLAPAFFAMLRRAPGVSVRDGLRALGFRGVGWGGAIGAFFLGLGVIIVASIAYSLIVETFKLPLQTNAETLQNQARYAPITTIALLAGAVLIAPFCEEVFFRGYLFGGLLRGMPAWIAIVLSALLFGIAHGDVGSFALLLVIGLVLAIMRWRLGSIWPGMLLHACNNATAAVAIFYTLAH
jgi:membrane protease YdiL (CAAX protease family)